MLCFIYEAYIYILYNNEMGEGKKNKINKIVKNSEERVEKMRK